MTNDKQEGFVNIETVFSEIESRELFVLKTIYDDRDRLLAIIDNLCKSELTNSKIKGKRVLLKPNWVRHSKREYDDVCLFTHPSFILAALEYILTKSPNQVVIGDAPVQGCNWDKLVSTKFYEEVNKLSKKYNIGVEIKDFRRVSFDPIDNKLIVEKNPLDKYIIFDVGKESYLEPISDSKKNLFRVSQYDPDRFKNTHKPGMHKYCIIKELFDSDVVISIPKVKTHQKAGITAALKNIVGFNGDKDFLPHHRIGGTEMGGDAYPGKNILRYGSELAYDQANRNKGKLTYKFWVKCAALLWKISMPGHKFHLSAAWYGNDTTWRMVMDLNKIVVFGKSDGSLAKTPQRFMYSLCDGIIGGQGDGPLKPDPLNLGVVSFSNDSAYTDICMATIMDLNVEKIPLLLAAKNFVPSRNVKLILNNIELTSLDLLKNISVHATPPPGWVDYEK